MTISKYLKLPSLALAMAFLSGCASLLNEDTQELNVRVMCSGKAVQAYCRAENSKGSWTFNSPGQVTVAGDNRGLEITCKTQFSQPLTVKAPALPSWEMAGNLIAGGIIGGVVDLYNNKGLRYPENIDITHSPLCSSPVAAGVAVVLPSWVSCQEQVVAPPTHRLWPMPA